MDVIERWMAVAIMTVTMLPAGGATPVSSADRATLLVGYWTCEKNCPDEDIAFTIEDGKRRYASWLHMRPAVVNAEWTLKGSDLTVRREGEVIYEWRIVRITKARLVLRDKAARAGGASENIVMKRVNVGK
jgi:hypothetical protein